MGLLAMAHAARPMAPAGAETFFGPEPAHPPLAFPPLAFPPLPADSSLHPALPPLHPESAQPETFFGPAHPPVAFPPLPPLHDDSTLPPLPALPPLHDGSALPPLPALPALHPESAESFFGPAHPPVAFPPLPPAALPPFPALPPLHPDITAPDPIYGLAHPPVAFPPFPALPPHPFIAEVRLCACVCLSSARAFAFELAGELLLGMRQAGSSAGGPGWMPVAHLGVVQHSG